MFFKLFNYFFPIKKSMLQLAKERLLENNIVIGIGEIDLENGVFFLVGGSNLWAKKDFNYLTVLFNDTTVAVKQDDEVIFIFNTTEEVNSIRKTLTHIYNTNKKEVYVK